MVSLTLMVVPQMTALLISEFPICEDARCCDWEATELPACSDADSWEIADMGGAPRIPVRMADPGVDGGVGPTMPRPEVAMPPRPDVPTPGPGEIGGRFPWERLLDAERDADDCPRSPLGMRCVRPRWESGVRALLRDPKPLEDPPGPGVAYAELLDCGVASDMFRWRGAEYMPDPILPGLLTGESRILNPGEALPRGRLSLLLATLAVLLCPTTASSSWATCDAPGDGAALLLVSMEAGSDWLAGTWLWLSPALSVSEPSVPGISIDG